MDSNLLKQIFFDQHQHWDAFVEKHKKHIRPNVIKEVQKFRGCGDPRIGFKILVCEGCHDIRRCPIDVKVVSAQHAPVAKPKNGVAC
jgi:hypothetical protein